ncbi:hypothetical protein [Pseudomonas hormoni]
MRQPSTGAARAFQACSSRRPVERDEPGEPAVTRMLTTYSRLRHRGKG